MSLPEPKCLICGEQYIVKGQSETLACAVTVGLQMHS